MEEFLNSVSYDQYKNIPSYNDLNQNVKIIFSGECYKNIMQMSIGSMNQNRETGSFFVGKIISTEPKVMYFDYNTSEFGSTRGLLGEHSAVVPTQNNIDELNSKIHEYETNGITPVVIHFHSHPRRGYYESFSDQDLRLYAELQVENQNCISLGMLGFPINNTSPTIGMCIVHPVDAEIVNGVGTANFRRCEDIYYTAENNIYKVGNFEKKYNGRLYQENINLGIVKQYLTLSPKAKVKVCAEGKDPNTGNTIQPTCVGYYDTAGHLYFTNENLSLNISNIQKFNNTRIR